jgi:hypothetical protein
MCIVGRAAPKNARSVCCLKFYFTATSYGVGIMTANLAVWLAKTVPALFFTSTVTLYVPEHADAGISNDRSANLVSFLRKPKANAPACEGRFPVTQVPGLVTCSVTLTA